VHVLRDDELVDGAQHLLAFRQEGGDDAGDASAVIERGARYFAHEAEAAAAVDEADAALRECAPKRLRRPRVSRIVALARSAIDTDVPGALPRLPTVHLDPLHHLRSVVLSRQSRPILGANRISRP
jgi:hypothetical protein